MLALWNSTLVKLFNFVVPRFPQLHSGRVHTLDWHEVWMSQWLREMLGSAAQGPNQEPLAVALGSSVISPRSALGLPFPRGLFFLSMTERPLSPLATPAPACPRK